MGEFVVYILFSETHNRHYVGFTSNLIERFKSHNLLANKGFTKKYKPWVVVHVEFFKTKNEAMKREQFLKSGAGRQWRKLHLKY